MERNVSELDDIGPEAAHLDISEQPQPHYRSIQPTKRTYGKPMENLWKMKISPGNAGKRCEQSGDSKSYHQ